MATTLTAIGLGARTLSAVTARANGQAPEILRSASAELAGTDAASVRDALRKCGVEGPRAVLVLPRGQAILRELELPAGTPEELVAMVRFQVERAMPLPLDQIRYSYVETGRDAGKVRVQVAAVPRDILDPAVAAVEGAGLKVDGATISTFGLLSLHSGAGPVALVEVSGGEAEILIADGGILQFSRTAPLPDGPTPDALAEEIDRTLLAYAAKAPGKEVRQVFLAGEGEEAAALAMDLRHRISREVAQVGPGDLETAPSAGVCLGLLRGRRVPDLLHPPTAEKRFRLTRWHRIGGLAAAVVLLLVVWSQVALAGRRDTLARLRKEAADLAPQVAELHKKRQQTEFGQKWTAEHREVWKPAFKALGRAINTDNLYVTHMVVDDAGVLTVKGKAKDDDHGRALVTALTAAKEVFKDVRYGGSMANGASGDFRRDFSLTAHLPHYDPGRRK